MKSQTIKRVLILITTTAIITLSIQVYRNIQIYQLNKQRFINEMRLSLDQGLEKFYAYRAKGELHRIFNDESDSTSVVNFTKGVFVGKNPKRDTLAQHVFSIITTDSNHLNNSEVTIGTDTLNYKVKDPAVEMKGDNFSSSIKITGDIDLLDSNQNLQAFAKKIMISLVRDDINFVTLSDYVDEELDRKDISVGYSLLRMDGDSIMYRTDSVNYPLATISQSTYLPRGQAIRMNFENSSLAILRSGLADLLISLLISLVVIGSLIYLYRIIRDQKELSEIKNDLISNITHEFKTPIATTLTAIEGISNFNQANDPAKTRKYLDISTDQLVKLDGMVEKLLLTATLDSNKVEVSTEVLEVCEFTSKLVENYRVNANSKTLNISLPDETVEVQVDKFHMENILGNLIDNAIKYGGTTIEVEVKLEGNLVLWRVIDDGDGISKEDRSRIFEKFYRVSSGNIHNTKGYGIGLYYAKSLMEKHGGKLELKQEGGKTIFQAEMKRYEA